MVARDGDEQAAIVGAEIKRAVEGGGPRQDRLRRMRRLDGLRRRLQRCGGEGGELQARPGRERRRADPFPAHRRAHGASAASSSIFRARRRGATWRRGAGLQQPASRPRLPPVPDPWARPVPLSADPRPAPSMPVPFARAAGQHSGGAAVQVRFSFAGYSIRRTEGDKRNRRRLTGADRVPIALAKDGDVDAGSCPRSIRRTKPLIWWGIV